MPQRDGHLQTRKQPSSHTKSSSVFIFGLPNLQTEEINFCCSGYPVHGIFIIASEWTKTLKFSLPKVHLLILPSGGSDGKASVHNVGDPGSIPGSWISPREWNGNPLQYSCLEIPWMEEPGRLQSMGSQRVGHDWATLLSFFSFLL